MNLKNLISLKNLTNLIFYLSILFFIIGFNFSDTMVGNWYQQFMPNIGGQQINDIIFLDSLTGYAVTSRNVNPDTASILKTTNGGDNWQIILTQTPKRFSKIQFIDANTGFACGGSGGGTPQLYKTTNAGLNWFLLSSFGCALWKDMFVLNNDTLWLVDNDGLCGGVFRTTNGGVNWTQQFSGGNQNPNKIYMYNARIGFHSNNSGTPNIYKTTNSGVNWSVLVTGEKFFDMSFVDSLTGWRTRGDTMKFTSNGGLNWSVQLMPYGGIIESNVVTRFSIINRDTVWASGGYVRFPNNQLRGIVYRTTNGGVNWRFQIPDTSLPIVAQYEFIKFINKRQGWCYANTVGIHTTNGGDTTWLLPVKQISNEVPKEFRLFQNYPNPFNPKTIINYELRITSNVQLKVFDLQGKEINVLVNQKQNAGTYEVDFDGANYSSGVYFYSLIVNDKLIDTKKMILIK